MSFIQRFEANSNEIVSGWKDYLKKDEDIPIVETVAKDPKDEVTFDDEDITPDRAIHKEVKDKKESLKKKGTEKPTEKKPADKSQETQKEEKPQDEKPQDGAMTQREEKGKFTLYISKDIKGKSILWVKENKEGKVVSSHYGETGEKFDSKDLDKIKDPNAEVTEYSKAYKYKLGEDSKLNPFYWIETTNGDILYARDAQGEIKQENLKNINLNLMTKVKEFSVMDSDSWYNKLSETANKGVKKNDEEVKLKKDDTGSRLDELKSMSPSLLVVSSRQNPAERTNFFKAIKPYLDNPAFHVILSADQPASNSLEDVDAMFIGKAIEPGVRKAINTASTKLPIVFVDFPPSNFDLGRPFDDIKFDSLAQINIQELRDALTEETKTLAEQEGKKTEQDPYDVSALQLSAFVPLNYLRFLNKTPKEFKFYIGGQPANAGMEDYIYILCEKQEAANFIKETAKLKQPINFYKNITSLSDIDPAFKELDPRGFTPNGAVVLTATDNFDVKVMHDPDTGARIEDVKSWQEKNKGKKPITQLQFLMDIANEYLGNKSLAGTYMKGTYGIGNMLVHFNRDFTKCILWASKPAVQIEKEKIMKLVNSFVEKLEDSYI
jgi:hypothetical protein